MRATIVGKARNLSISCENGDKRLLGDVYAEGHGFIRAAFDDAGSAEQSPKSVEGFISIFGQRSEALRRLLVVRNLDNHYQQVIDQYADLRNLTTFDREGVKLFISVMLDATDFNYFIGFIEANFFTELEYIMDLPFHELPADAEAQASVTARYGYILPIKRDFKIGKPCFFPNAGISFSLEHAPPTRDEARRMADQLCHCRSCCAATRRCERCGPDVMRRGDVKCTNGIWQRATPEFR
jgi:hypothetical protein